MTEQAGSPGRRKYTDEPTVALAAVFLADAEQRWREDAARLRVTLGAMTVELSRLYMDDDIRQLVIDRALQQSRLPPPRD